jgi:hypothetical protein
MTDWKRTHCIRGHEWTHENTRVDARGKRRCRACVRAWNLRHIEERRAAARTAARARVITFETRARRSARWRERYATDPEFRAREVARNLAHLNARYATDPEFRERRKAMTRARYASDPERRVRRKESARARYANDPEYRAREKARSLANSRAVRAARSKPL